MSESLWMWKRSGFNARCRIWLGPVGKIFGEGVAIVGCALARDLTGVARINTQFSEHSSRTQRKSFSTHDAQGGDVMNATPFSKTRLWICRRRCALACEREGRAAAPIMTEPPRAQRGEGGSPVTRKTTFVDHPSPKKCAGETREWSSPRMAWPITGLAQASLGLAPTPALWLDAEPRHWGWHRRRAMA